MSPTLFSTPDDVLVATDEVLPVSTDFSANLEPGDSLTSPSAVLIDDAGHAVILTDAATIPSSQVAASPAPTTTSFSVLPGDGAVVAAGPNPVAGRTVIVGGVLATLLSVVDDAVALQSALDAPPVAGVPVLLGRVRQIIRGAELSPKRQYRLDVTVTLNAGKILSSSTYITCPR